MAFNLQLSAMYLSQFRRVNVCLFHERIRLIGFSSSSIQTPPNRPKWNTVSKIRSVNSVYNPKMTNTNVVN